MSTVYEQKKEEFLRLFANDPDLPKLPLPDSVREKLNLWASVDYMKPSEAVAKCLFSGARYDGHEERKPDETIQFPDLTHIATIQNKIDITPTQYNMDIAGNIVD